MFENETKKEHMDIGEQTKEVDDIFFHISEGGVSFKVEETLSDGMPVLRIQHSAFGHGTEMTIAPHPDVFKQLAEFFGEIAKHKFGKPFVFCAKQLVPSTEASVHGTPVPEMNKRIIDSFKEMVIPKDMSGSPPGPPDAINQLVDEKTTRKWLPTDAPNPGGIAPTGLESMPVSMGVKEVTRTPIFDIGQREPISETLRDVSKEVPTGSTPATRGEVDPYEETAKTMWPKAPADCPAAQPKPEEPWENVSGTHHGPPIPDISKD